MSEVKIVQIRKKGGLDKIIKDVNSGTTLDPILYNTTSKDKNEEGVMEGKYRGKTILDTKHFIAPMWLEQKNQWAFDGNTQDLSRLIDKMKLRYPKNHPRERAIIRSSSEDAERLTNRHDDVFCHPDLYGKYFMENGRISLNLADAKQEFLYLCYRGDTAVEDKSSDEKVSKYIRAGAKYELVSPKKETIKAKKHADKEVKAIKLLAAMDNDEERLRAIATIMELPQYSHTTDISGVFLFTKGYGGTERFV